jgi:lipopolysaccharide transport protein LptA
LATILVAAFARLLSAQEGIIVENFTVSPAYYPPPNEKQMKSKLEGLRAQDRGDGKYLVTQAKLQTFREDGGVELAVETPQCSYDRATRVISSPGSLRAQTANGRFTIQGEGFSWDQTNSILTVSNNAQTIIQPAILTSGNAAASKKPSAGPSTPLTVASRRFTYNADTGFGVYQGDVRVTGTNLSMTGGTLTLKVPRQEQQLQSVAAETDVVFDYATAKGPPVHATAQKANYAADTGLVRLEGEPKWRVGDREGRARELVLDPTNRIFRASGNGWLRMPVSSETGGLLPAVPGAAGQGASKAGTVVEIQCETYEVRTNRAVFAGDVRLAEKVDARETGGLSCALLTAEIGASNQVTRVEARTNVVITREDMRLIAERAVHDNKAGGTLELTGRPSWKAGERSGKGDLLSIREQQQEMTVRGNASMELPAAEFGPLKTGKGAAVAASANAPGKAISDRAEVFSSEYVISPDKARFRGGVYVTHPQMNWSCEDLAVAFPAQEQRTASVTAERRVAFDLLDDNGGKVHGTGDRALFERSESRVATNQILKLAGNPATLQATNMTFRNKLIVVDLARNSILASGSYNISGLMSGFQTNLLTVPGQAKKPRAGATPGRQ